MGCEGILTVRSGIAMSWWWYNGAFISPILLLFKHIGPDSCTVSHRTESEDLYFCFLLRFTITGWRDIFSTVLGGCEDWRGTSCSMSSCIPVLVSEWVQCTHRFKLTCQSLHCTVRAVYSHCTSAPFPPSYLPPWYITIYISYQPHWTLSNTPISEISSSSDLSTLVTV